MTNKTTHFHAWGYRPPGIQKQFALIPPTALITEWAGGAHYTHSPARSHYGVGGGQHVALIYRATPPLVYYTRDGWGGIGRGRYAMGIAHPQGADSGERGLSELLGLSPILYQ